MPTRMRAVNAPPERGVSLETRRHDQTTLFQVLGLQCDDERREPAAKSVLRLTQMPSKDRKKSRGTGRVAGESGDAA